MQMKFWRYFFDILLLLSPHTAFLAPLLVANTSSGSGSGTDTYFKMTAKTHDFFSNIYGNTQNVHSNRWKTKYQIHLFISKIQKKKKRKKWLPYFCGLLKNLPNLNIFPFKNGYDLHQLIPLLALVAGIFQQWVCFVSAQ